jgi:WD40 repeat protein
MSPISENATDESALNSVHISEDSRYIAAYIWNEKTLKYFDRSGSLLWSQTFSAESDPWLSSISIAPDGSAVAVSQLVPGCCHGAVTNTTSNQIILFDRNGSVLWNYSALFPPLAVAISPDNRRIYAGFSDGRIVCLNRDGLVQWVNTTDAPVHAFAISGDGQIIAAAGTGSSGTSPYDVSYPWDFFIFSQSGIQISRFRTGGPNAVAISNDGTTIAVVGGKSGILFLFNRSGTMVRERSFPGTGVSLAMSRDASRILVGTPEGTVYGLDAAGSILWEKKVSGLSRTITVAGDGSSLVYGDNSMVIRTDPSGRVLWQYPTGARVSGVALSADGRYLGAISDQVYFFNLDTRVSGTQTTVPAFTSSQNGPPPAGEAYLFQAGPTTIPPQLCEPLDNSLIHPPSITIDPIGWHSAGEPFLITGTTLLPADHEILIEVITADFMSHRSQPREFFGQTGTMRSTTGPDGVGRWEYPVNTSGWIPDRYLVQVIPVSDVVPPVTGRFYLLSPEDATGFRHYPVTVDPVQYHYDGETFPVGGTTTLPPGEELTISLVPGSFPLMAEAPASQYNGIPGVVGKTRVEFSSNGVNRWSFNLNTTGLDPVTYVIDLYSPSGKRAGQGFFFLDYNPGRVCRILTVPVTPPLTPSQTQAAAALPPEIVLGSILCGAIIIAGRVP